MLATVVATAGLLAGLASLNRRAHRAKPMVPVASASVAVPPSATPPADSVPTPSPMPSAATTDYRHLPDGRPVPALPATAPRQVSFGVVLFTFEGAQLAPHDARPKQEALKLANRALATAKDDFGEAVKTGDPGSSVDKGWIPRGVLEPAIEYLLFTLDKGAIYPHPLQTPRGYWVMRRNK